MRRIRISAFSLAAVALGACAGQPQWPVPILSAEPERTASIAPSRTLVQAQRSAPAEAGDSYKLNAGDRVRVVVAGQDALSGSYEVGGGGAIDIPSVGAVAARGLNTVQLSGAIARKLKQQKVREAHVAVQIETYRPFTIRGGVANPGQYPYVNNMTAETAIAIAGGLKAGADKDTIIVSGDGQNGRMRGQASLDSPVRPGDTVVVPEER